MAALARLQARGQFTVPESVRRATALQPGDSLLVRAVGRGRFEVIVLPHVSAEEFFDAMALREDLTSADVQRAVTEGVGVRVSSDRPSLRGSAYAEAAVALEPEAPD